MLLFDGFDELDAVAPYEVFQTAAEFGAELAVSLVTLAPTERVTASHGLAVEPDDVLIGTPDLVLVPGSGWNSVAPEAQRSGDGDSAEQSSADRSSGLRGGEAASNGTAGPSPGPREEAVEAQSEQGVRGAVEDGQLPDRLGTLHEGGATIASVCTGAMLLADAGLLDGRPATTHESAKDDLREYDSVEVRDDRFVDDGDVLTAGGVTSGIDLALHVVDRECGSEIAEQVREEIEYDP